MLPRSALITVEGWGHTSLFLSSCVDAHVNRYLLTGQASGRDTVCGVDVIPFAQPSPVASADVVSPWTSVLPPIPSRQPRG
jgi:TAP-like protein